MITVDMIKKADALARKKFTYKNDPKGTDRWRSFSKDVLAGKYWQGDCDDLASTTLDILAQQNPGIDLSKLYRFCVKSPDCPPKVPYDHMVAGAVTDKGLYIIGDTFGSPVPVKSSKHKISRYSKLSEGITWRAGVPTI